MTRDHTQLGATLTHAHDLLTGDRAESYGDPDDTMARAALAASCLLNRTVTADECFAHAVALKLAREGGRHKDDNLVDGCAYMDAWNRHRESADAPVNNSITVTHRKEVSP